MIDIILCGMLLITISASFILNQRISQLKKLYDKMEKFALDFNLTISKSKEITEKIDKSFEEISFFDIQMKEIQTLKQDLNYAMDRGELLIERIQKTLSKQSSVQPQSASKENFQKEMSLIQNKISENKIAENKAETILSHLKNLK